MSYTFNRPATAKHEAGHAAGLILRGRVPALVTADRPRDGINGFMDAGWGEDEELTPEAARTVALSVLLGPLANSEPDWPPEWPPVSGIDGDEGQLAACVSYLDLDESDYAELLAEARTLAATPEFNRLLDLIARALELADELDAEGLTWLVGADTLADHGIPNPQPQENENAA